MLKGYHGLLCVHYLCPKSGEGRKVRSVFAKMRAIRKKQLRPQFPKCCFHIESAFSQVGHCGFHRHQTKLYVSSALVLAMYGRSTELGLYLWGNGPLPGPPIVRVRWVSPKVRSPQQQIHPPCGCNIKCPCTVGAPAWWAGVNCP